MWEAEILGDAQAATGAVEGAPRAVEDAAWAVEAMMAIEVALWEYAGCPALFKQKVKGCGTCIRIRQRPLAAKAAIEV